MKIIYPSVSLEKVDGIELLQKIEKAGRTCYKSDSKITEESYIPFIRGVIKRAHFSVIEHGSITATIIVDRGLSHEIVRHRVGSYSQESTRYVNYKEGIEVIQPLFWNGSPKHIGIDRRDYPEINYKFFIWKNAMLETEKHYIDLIKAGAKPEEARTVLPNSLKTELVMTYNLRQWRHFFYLRGAKGAHIQMREVAVMLLKKMKDMIPIIFDDFIINERELLISTDISPAS